MRRWYQYKLRTLFLATAVLALALGLGPQLWRRYRVHNALEVALTGGPTEFYASGELSPDWAYALADLDRVSEHLLAVARSDPDFTRRHRAAETLTRLLCISDSSELRGRYGRQLLDLAVEGKAFRWKAIAGDFAGLLDSVPISAKQRAVILTEAQSAWPDSFACWAPLLAAMGNREGIALLLEHGGEPDHDLLYAIHNSPLSGYTWPGLLPYLENWLDDPVVGPYVIHYEILKHTDTGRQMLLRYASDSSHPLELRKQVFLKLQMTEDGTGLLLAAAKDPATAPALGELVQGNMETALQELPPDRRRRFWNNLINGLDPQRDMCDPCDSLSDWQYASYRQEYVGWHLQALQAFSRRKDLQTQDEWRRWYRRHQPATPPQKEILQFSLEHPEMQQSFGFSYFFTPHRIGHIPHDCVGLYREALHGECPLSRYWAMKVLVDYLGDPEAVPVAIEFIDQMKPGEPLKIKIGQWWCQCGQGDSGPLHSLKHRFAVNFFWDTAAWRTWWTKYSKQNRTREAQP